MQHQGTILSQHRPSQKDRDQCYYLDPQLMDKPDHSRENDGLSNFDNGDYAIDYVYQDQWRGNSKSEA